MAWIDELLHVFLTPVSKASTVVMFTTPLGIASTNAEEMLVDPFSLLPNSLAFLISTLAMISKTSPQFENPTQLLNAAKGVRAMTATRLSVLHCRSLDRIRERERAKERELERAREAERVRELEKVRETAAKEEQQRKAEEAKLALAKEMQKQREREEKKKEEAAQGGDDDDDLFDMDMSVDIDDFLDKSASAPAATTAAITIATLSASAAPSSPLLSREKATMHGTSHASNVHSTTTTSTSSATSASTSTALFTTPSKPSKPSSLDISAAPAPAMKEYPLIYDAYALGLVDRDQIGTETNATQALTSVIAALSCPGANRLILPLQRPHARNCPVGARLRREREDRARLDRENELQRKRAAHRAVWGLAPSTIKQLDRKPTTMRSNASPSKRNASPTKSSSTSTSTSSSSSSSSSTSTSTVQPDHNRATLASPFEADPACECGAERPAHVAERLQALQLLRFGRARRVDNLAFARSTLAHVQALAMAGCSFATSADFVTILTVMAETEEVLYAEASSVLTRMTAESRKIW